MKISKSVLACALASVLALGVAGAAVSAPVEFADGDVLRAADLNLNFEEVDKYLSFLHGQLPVAHGIVDKDGTKLAGSDNWTVEAESPGSNIYYIAIDGVDYEEHKMPTLATVGSNGVSISVDGVGGMNGGELVVETFGANGASKPERFNFFVYRK